MDDLVHLMTLIEREIEGGWEEIGKILPAILGGSLIRQQHGE